MTADRFMPFAPDRRAMMAGWAALALAGCDSRPAAARAALAVPPLKMAAPFPVGSCVDTGLFEDPARRSLLLANVSQVTAEWQMKMETILRDDGGFAFEQPDRIADFAGRQGLRLHGHTLIWYAQNPVAFQKIDGQRAAFAAAYRNYIAAVAGRYRGRAVSWDVVNEAVSEDGGALRDCLWSRNLDTAYISDAFHLARAADERAVLFLNDYNLESNPAKRRTFLRLAESLLRAGAPLGGLGTQTHLDIALDPAVLKPAFRDLASLGLPIHVSELDVSTRTGGLDFGGGGGGERLQAQARLVHAVVEAFMALPPRQRFAITVWGLRDKDSWLQKPPRPAGVDRPALFDDQGRPKPAAAAFVAAASGA